MTRLSWTPVRRSERAELDALEASLIGIDVLETIRRIWASGVR